VVEAGAAGPARLLGALFLVGSMPFLRQMTAGQMNIIVLAAVILALGWLIRGRDTAAGVALGLAAAFKIAPFFFLLPLLGLRRRRAVAGLLGGFICGEPRGARLGGAGVHADAVPVLSQMGYGQSTWAEFGMDFYRDPFNQSFNALFHHLLTENPYRARGSTSARRRPMPRPGWPRSRSLALRRDAAGFLDVGRRCRGTSAWGERETALYLVGLMLMLLLPSLLWDHYCVQALPVLFWIVGRPAPPSRRWVAASVAAVVFVLMSYPGGTRPRPSAPDRASS
jgi:hypothetical protein